MKGKGYGLRRLKSSHFDPEPYGCYVYLPPRQVWHQPDASFIQLSRNYSLFIGSLKIHGSGPKPLVSLSAYLSASLGSIPATSHVGSNKPAHVIDGKSSPRSPLPRRPIIGHRDHSSDPIGRLGRWLAYLSRVSTHTADRRDVITPLMTSQFIVLYVPLHPVWQLSFKTRIETLTFYVLLILSESHFY